MKVYVIGGGPAGMVSAIFARRKGFEVILLERNEKTGKKLFITGKGRCNLTNASSVQNHIENTVHNGKFMNGALRSFDSSACMEFFEKAGVSLKVERGNRVFPVSDKSNDILQALNREMKKEGVDVHLNERVISVSSEKGKIISITTEKTTYEDIRHVILATGGMTYPTTGSTGDGYAFSQKTGHCLIEPRPSLCDILLKNHDRSLQGLSLKNVEGKITDERGKVLFSEFGEMLFTDEGVGGPVVLSLSAQICRANCDKMHFVIDLKPALTPETLDKRLIRDCENLPNKALKNLLCGLIPKTLIDCLLRQAKVNGEKAVHDLTKEERKKIANVLKGLSFDILKTDEKRAVITSGGVSVKNINPKNMRSKIIENLSFAGEIIDVDALTGGYNLQIAFSTGYSAGNGVE